jgi:hypothetical protein
LKIVKVNYLKTNPNIVNGLTGVPTDLSKGGHLTCVNVIFHLRSRAMESIPIAYDKILHKDKKTITFQFSDTEIIRLVKSFLDEHRKQEKAVDIPVWYAKKEKLI